MDDSDDQIIQQEEEKKSQGEADSSMGEDQEAFSKEDLRCRFYRNEWPEIDEVVVVSVINCLFDLACRLKSVT